MLGQTYGKMSGITNVRQTYRKTGKITNVMADIQKDGQNNYFCPADSVKAGGYFFYAGKTLIGAF